MVYSYLVIYVMVEAVVYEEIFFQQGKHSTREGMAASDTDSENKDDATNAETIHASSVYVKMNEMNLEHIEEIDGCQTYHSHLKHRLSSSGSSENSSYVSNIAYPPPYTQELACSDMPDEFEITAKMSYTPPFQRSKQIPTTDNSEVSGKLTYSDMPDEFEITAKMSYTPPFQRRAPVIPSENENDNGIPIFQPPTSRRSQLYAEKEPSQTIYTKVVAAPTIPVDQAIIDSDGTRETRESDNPILRQDSVPERICLIKRATSLDDIHVSGKTGNHYEFINIRNKRNGRARSCEERKRVRSLHYENSKHDKVKCVNGSYCSRKRRSYCDHPDSCNNVKGRRYENEIVEFGNRRKGRRYENDIIAPKTTTTSLYENICEEHHHDDEQYYESVSDQESAVSISARERSTSRPIDIKLYTKKNINYELHYSDIDFRKTAKPASCSSSSVSARGSISSSMSSDKSSFASNSISPPPVPTLRQRMNRLSSNLSCLSGLNSFPASYLGETTLSRITPDCIDTAVKNIAHDTNFLEMKPVLVDVSQENIRFESTSTTWDILVNLPIEGVIRYEVFLKNALYVAILAGQPGEEACCYVLQSEKANEIHDSIRGVLQNYTQISAPRVRSAYDISPTIEPESHRFHYIVKIGSVKVKRSFPLVNDYMKKVLDRVNPKEFKSCNLDIYRNSVVISCTDTREMETHSTPAILNIDLDEKDRRYFGFIISEKAPNDKTKIMCYVYRAAREITAEKIIEAIHGSCKIKTSSTYFPNASMCTISCKQKNTSSYFPNPIYDTARSASVGRLSSISRTTRFGMMPSCSSMSTLSHYSLSSSTPCPSDSSPSSGNSRKSSVADVGWKYDNASLSSMEPTDNRLLRTNSVKSETLFEAVEQIVETQKPVISDSTEENVNEERLNKLPGYKSKRSKLFGKIKQTLLTNVVQNFAPSDTRRPNSAPVVVSPTDALVPPPPALETSSYDVKYICSTVISPPLKEKRVKEIHRQFQKEVEMNGRPHTSNSIGKMIDLQIITSEGVFLLDRNKNNIIERQFAVQLIERFMKHPDGNGFFAFSVKIPDNSKHKCHLFWVNKKDLPSIDAAFQTLLAMKELIASVTTK